MLQVTEKNRRAGLGPFALLTLLTIAILLAGTASAQRPAQGGEELGSIRRTVWHDWVDEAGQLHGGPLELELPEARATGVLEAHATTLRQADGPPALLGGAPLNTSNRVDLVFVGDGYRMHQLGGYAARVESIAEGMFLAEPYRTYASYFNVHRVDVVSNQSGVDHAPTFGVQKDTALDMAYWHNGIPRLLWVNVAKAQEFANNAPDWDFIVALANRGEHGGASLTGSGVVTAAANHALVNETVKHELGHGIGALADEYYTAGTTWDGGYELPQPNVSILNAAAMATAGTKWARWLGAHPVGFDGPVTSISGGYYHQFGVRRPSGNSLMRSLGRPFNAPCAEALVLEIYQIVSPIDDSADTNFFYGETDTLWVRPLEPEGQALEVSWTLDGEPIPGATEPELDLCTLTIPAGWHAVGVTVVDPTPLVRDEEARTRWMTATRYFVVNSTGSTVATNFCEAGTNSAGTQATVSLSGSTSLAVGQFELKVAGCPPAAEGIFFWGSEPAALPFGDGVLCVAGDMLRMAPRTTDASGAASMRLEPDRLPSGARVAAGDARHVQFWYRDARPRGAGFNLSNGLTLTFCP